jgi:hypothetical protein
MARKLAHKTETDRVESPDSDSTGDHSLKRREYARLVSTAIAALLTLPGAVATATAVDSGHAEAEHHLRISGSGTAMTYELTVDGSVTPGVDSSADAEARISDCTAEGVLIEGERRYRFSGDLQELDLDGDADVTLDGVELR